MFGALMKGIAQDFVKYVMHVQVVRNDAPVLQNVQEVQAEPDSLDAPAAPSPGQAQAAKTVVNKAGDWSATPRNAPCPCGSGKKFKLCHGRG